MRAASRAALSRSGLTSVACIEPEVSCTSITVPWRCSTAIVRSGPPERDAERGEREQREQRRQVPAARLARDAGEHVDRRIADRVAPAPPLRDQ